MSSQALVVSLSTIECSFVYHTSRGVQGFDHPDLPALRVTLNAAENYLFVRFFGEVFIHIANGIPEGYTKFGVDSRDIYLE